jgi:hypothetical protein
LVGGGAIAVPTTIFGTELLAASISYEGFAAFFANVSVHF